MSHGQNQAAFLGPKAENQEYFESLLLEAFRDYCYWRKNFHPEDQPYVSSDSRLHPDFLRFRERLQSNLFQVLSHLKRSVPFFSPRYLGHMNTDLLMPGLLGYIAAMFYNQNNIVQEAATLTMHFEREGVKLLAQMLGYNIDEAWGHLCSGGTSANMESLWVARQIKLFPYHLALFLKQYPAGWHELGQIDQELLQKCAYSPIKLSVREATHLYTQLLPILQANPLHSAQFKAWAPTELGLVGFYQACHEKGIDIPQFKILYSRNAHYSMKKSLGVIGLGEAQVHLIDLDENLRLDTAKLSTQIQEICQEPNQDVLAVVGVYGSTEEGSIDDFAAIQKIRAELQEKQGRDFWLHCDACYGGYALAMHSRTSGAASNLDQLFEELIESLPKDRPEETPETIQLKWSETQISSWLAASEALANADSISLDPHKLGYIPYPAGSVLYRDYRVREFIRCDAPYLNAQLQQTAALSHWDNDYLGKYTLEGSRPGAYGVAIWLAHATVPLNPSGHGSIVAASVLGARRVQQSLQSMQEANSFFLCPEPDLNILCYTFPRLRNEQPVSLNALNRAVKRIYEQLLTSEDSPAHTRQFVVAETSLDIASYGKNYLNQLISKMYPGRHTSDRPVPQVTSEQLNPWRDDDKIRFFRTVVMHPHLLQAHSQPHFSQPERSVVREFATFITNTIDHTLDQILNEPLPWSGSKLRLPDTVDTPCLLMLEDDPRLSSYISEQLCQYYDGLDVKHLSVQNCFDPRQVENRNIIAALVDIQLLAQPEGGLQFLEYASIPGNLPHFKGAVVFSGHTQHQARVEGMGGDFRYQFVAKPNLNTPHYQAAMNQVLERLWDILYLKP